MMFVTESFPSLPRFLTSIFSHVSVHGDISLTHAEEIVAHVCEATREKKNIGQRVKGTSALIIIINITINITQLNIMNIFSILMFFNINIFYILMLKRR